MSLCVSLYYDRSNIGWNEKKNIIVSFEMVKYKSVGCFEKDWYRNLCLYLNIRNIIAKISIGFQEINFKHFRKSNEIELCAID
jgi:hypothetical protein